MATHTVPRAMLQAALLDTPVWFPRTLVLAFTTLVTVWEAQRISTGSGIC